MSIFDIVLKMSVRTHEARVSMKKKALGAVVAFAAANPVFAHADGDIAGMVDSASTGASDMEKDALIIAEFIGVIAVIGGLIAAKNKKDNPQIKTSHIMSAILFGVCLVSLSEIVRRSQSQVGLTNVTVGSGS